MLVLSRKTQQSIRIGESITVTVVRIKGNTVRIGIDAPESIKIVRAELPDFSSSKVEVPEAEAEAGEPYVVGPFRLRAVGQGEAIGENPRLPDPENLRASSSFAAVRPR
ncbi:MAG: carbon storage regulator [Planctomycetota bacterium]|nr:carbon storage regulator [Planctomycetota bacterium]